MKLDLFHTLTQVTQSHRMQSSNASKQFLNMELSFHSKEDSNSNPHLLQEVSYEEESSVNELITELKKPGVMNTSGSAAKDQLDGS